MSSTRLETTRATGRGWRCGGRRRHPLHHPAATGNRRLLGVALRRMSRLTTTARGNWGAAAAGDDKRGQRDIRDIRPNGSFRQDSGVNISYLLTKPFG